MGIFSLFFVCDQGGLRLAMMLHHTTSSSRTPSVFRLIVDRQDLISTFAQKEPQGFHLGQKRGIWYAGSAVFRKE